MQDREEDDTNYIRILQDKVMKTIEFYRSIPSCVIFQHDILHGTKWIPFHGPPNTTLDPFKRGGSNAKTKDCGNN